MIKVKSIKSILIGTSCLGMLASAAHGEEFNIPGGDLTTALNAYAAQTGIQLVVSAPAVKGVYSHGVTGNLSPEKALSKVLSDTGFSMERRASGAVAIVREQTQSSMEEEPAAALTLAQAQLRAPSVETVTVTSSKLGGADVQSVPIAITALSQEQLTATQTTGGPDLVKQVPNLTFSENELYWLQHPNSRHRYSGNFGDNRSRRRCRVQ